MLSPNEEPIRVKQNKEIVATAHGIDGNMEIKKKNVQNVQNVTRGEPSKINVDISHLNKDLKQEITNLIDEYHVIFYTGKRNLKVS